MNSRKALHVDNDNVAVPEVHSEGFDEKQSKADEEENKELKKKDIVYDNVAIPEIHIRRKKKK